MERRIDPRSQPERLLTVEGVACSMGVTSVEAVVRITEEIEVLLARGQEVDIVEYTIRALMRVE